MIEAVRSAYYIMLKSVPGTNQYWALMVKFLAQGNISDLDGVRILKAVPRLQVKQVNEQLTIRPDVARLKCSLIAPNVCIMKAS